MLILLQYHAIRGCVCASDYLSRLILGRALLFLALGLRLPRAWRELVQAISILKLPSSTSGLKLRKLSSLHPSYSHHQCHHHLHYPQSSNFHLYIIKASRTYSSSSHVASSPHPIQLRKQIRFPQQCQPWKTEKRPFPRMGIFATVLQVATPTPDLSMSNRLVVRTSSPPTPRPCKARVKMLARMAGTDL